ncbi:hypothetical protein AA313_de0200114 [Arthrobotrys entomopaga]|nr:hypothetical protein AA313_de0200114 [Arthrobotrys entomopaga]
MTPRGRKVIFGICSLQWGKLVTILRNTGDAQESQPDAPLEFTYENSSRMLSERDEKMLERKFELRLLSGLSDLNRAFGDSLRENLLRAPIFCDSDLLGRVKENPVAGELGLDQDAIMRLKIMEQLPDRFTPEAIARFDTDTPGEYQCQKCSKQSHTAENKKDEEEEEGEELEVVSGAIDKKTANTDFLMFPGKINKVPIEPLIDTGGGCNLVKAIWLKNNNIPVEYDPERVQSLRLADGSVSAVCPVIRTSWSFDDMKKLWVDVDFVVVEDFKYDALIGMPFIRHTQILHNSQGRLCYPELRGLPAGDGPIPLYEFGVSPQS